MIRKKTCIIGIIILAMILSICGTDGEYAVSCAQTAAVQKVEAKTYDTAEQVSTAWNQKEAFEISFQGRQLYIKGRTVQPAGSYIKIGDSKPVIVDSQGNYSLYYDTGSLEDGKLELKRWFGTLSGNRYSFTSQDADKITLYVGNGTAFYPENKLTEHEYEFIGRLNESNPEAFRSTDYLKEYGYTKEQIAALKKAAAAITEGAAGDYEKIERIYGWVAGNIYYDYDSLVKNVNTEQDPYTVWKNKRGVCVGYSELCHIFMRLLDIPSVIVYGYASKETSEALLSSREENHEWNAAYAEDAGRWVVFDSTWGSRNRYEAGRYEAKEFRYNYFDVTGEYFSESHISQAFGTTDLSDWFKGPVKKLTLEKGGTGRLSVSSRLKYEVSYQTKDNDIISVDESGRITARKTGNAQVVTVVKCFDQNYYFFTKVTVVVPGITITKKTASVKAGKTFIFAARPVLTGSEKVTWSVSNKNGTINSKTGQFKGIKKGTVKITAKSGTYKKVITVKVL